MPADVWNSLVPSTNGVVDNPFLDHAFFLALEQSNCATAETGWLPQHIVLQDQNSAPIGLMPLFLKSHSMGEYVFDHGWADALERAGGKYYPKLQGSVPFTPATAPKLLVPNGDLDAQAALLQTAQQLTHRLNASSTHLTFVPESEAELAGNLGWLRRTDTQFHWFNRGYESFDHFLETLASRKRKTIRRERNDALADGLTARWLTGSDIKEHHWDAFYDFYEDTGARKWGRPYLNREFFSRLGETMADRILLIFAYDGDESIAGAINFIGKDTLYGRNWGATRDVPFLHFEICYYQAIDFAIQHRLAVVDDFLIHERKAVLRSQIELEEYTPFRKGERQ
ncbi:GNAT family N-acetyltransferase [Devosia sp. MC521]|uniref:GNAT family N-acetyltransferase n=1 Tax=Devosia sp. MC521 TaxID=2759954 RepID=UPI0020BF8C83|nr:GNAT family N-acetyltransferase [Devosia sp. MC521]